MTQRPQRNCSTCHIAIQSHIGPSGRYCKENYRNPYQFQVTENMASLSDSERSPDQTVRTPHSKKSDFKQTMEKQSERIKSLSVIPQSPKEKRDMLQAIRAENDQLQLDLELEEEMLKNEALKSQAKKPHRKKHTDTTIAGMKSKSGAKKKVQKLRLRHRSFQWQQLRR